MKIVMLKTFGNLLKGEEREVSESTGEKLCRLGYSKPFGEKELKVIEETKEFKPKKKTK